MLRTLILAIILYIYHIYAQMFLLLANRGTKTRGAEGRHTFKAAPPKTVRQPSDRGGKETARLSRPACLGMSPRKEEQPLYRGNS